jgi:hypothetical protein
VVVQAARRALARRCLQGRVVVEPEPSCVVEDRQRPEPLADLAEDGVDRVLEGGPEIDAPEYLGAALVGEVGDLLAVLDAVARVVEAGVGRVRARVECRRGRDHLERRAGRVEARGRAVDQRRSGGAVHVPCPAGDLGEAPLDQVRVVGRRRRHHEHRAGPGVERDHGAAVAVQCVQRRLLCLRVDREHEVVPGDGCALQRVHRAA